VTVFTQVLSEEIQAAIQFLHTRAISEQLQNIGYDTEKMGL
jgi:hypothetical protein